MQASAGNGSGRLSLAVSLKTAIDEQGVRLSQSEFERFLDHLDYSRRQRQLAHRRWSKSRLSNHDILRLAHEAHDAGDHDEAFWCAFIAAHFGRTSAEGTEQVRSASRFLCGFEAFPKWTWQAVTKSPEGFRRWLLDHEDALRTLRFGNHRKYESSKPHALWEVIESFLVLTENFGGSPAAIFNVEPSETSEPQSRFDVLYRRLTSLHHFGRTGCFDFLALLTELNMIDATPASCYLRGATGPRTGAYRLWGRRPIGELDRLAADLAKRLSVSPLAVEDALCNWQKAH